MPDSERMSSRWVARPRRRRRWPMAAGLAVAAVALAAGLAADESGDAKALNPHWKADGCATCHGAGQPKKISPADADRLCLLCHDGQRARRETHPVGRPLDPEHFNKPPDWPLTDGRLGCLTCHQPIKACDAKARRPMLNPMFLRGRVVGSVVRALCTSCHQAEDYQRLNPHVQRAPGPGNKIIRSRCDFCHSEPLSRDAKVRTGHPALHREELALCRGCHPSHVEYFDPGHVNARPKAGARRRAESLPDLVGPLRDDRIVCTTCHNPHEQGVFAPGSELDRRSFKAIGPDTVKTTVDTRRLCQACHEMTRGSLTFKPKIEGEEESPAPSPPRPTPNVCPVDGKKLEGEIVKARIGGREIRFCSMKCLRLFQVDPEKYLKPSGPAGTTQPDEAAPAGAATQPENSP